MNQKRILRGLGLLILAICLNVEVKSQKVSTTIESDLSLSSNIGKNGSTDPIKPVESSNETMNSTSITESSNENLGNKLSNPEIIPVNMNFTQDSCFNRTLPINCSNSNSTLLVPITSRFTTTIVGDSNNSGIKYEFKSEDDSELISFRLNSNENNAIVKVSSLVNGTQVNDEITSLELKGNQDDFTMNSDVTNSTSSAGRMIFVMVLTNTTVSFSLNNLVYNILNINLAKKPIRISKIQTSGLENVKISVIPFIENDEMERCVLNVPVTGTDVSNLNISPYSKTCLSSNVVVPESTLVPGSQIVLGIPGSVSSKSVKMSSTTHVILNSKSGLILFHLFVNDKGLFLKGTSGTDIIQSKGGYFPLQSYGFQSYAIKLVFTSLFVTISVNGFYAFDPVVIPNGEIPFGITFKGLYRNPTSTILPTRPCTRYSYSGTGTCSIDGVLPILKSSGNSQTKESHGQTMVAVRVVSDSTNNKKETIVSFNNDADVSEFLVGVNGRSAVLITNLTNHDKVDYENMPQNDTFMLRDENVGGLRRSYFNNLENVQSTRVSRALNDYSINISGENIAKISSEFKPTKKSCVLEQHRGSYISTICNSNRLCFASGSTGSPVGGILHFIGGFYNGILKVKIYTRKEDFSFEIEYTRSGNINVYRTSAIKENEPIYKGNYLSSDTSSFGRAIISIKDLGQFMLLSIDKMEVTKISKGGYGPDGNISCVQFFANESDDVSIFFEIQS
ncbi:signal peptide containing [Cryptosporidium sp. chipmunk genotype I]|uniref:signal peptide containing n=1 Tax=Cryptosporidium sp. chipmunk genotype I TaxID=1280935 RepID=UPI00351A3350|nr:signal peptide containing [Cryptosporidium sp. chipmunk genotype I]